MDDIYPLVPAPVIRYVSQATEPVLTVNGKDTTLWNDTTTGRKWLVARVGGLTLKSEMT